jgi:hypothetical protein
MLADLTGRMPWKIRQVAETTVNASPPSVWKLSKTKFFWIYVIWRGVFGFGTNAALSVLVIGELRHKFLFETYPITKTAAACLVGGFFWGAAMCEGTVRAAFKSGAGAGQPHPKTPE